ncbi:MULTISPECIES: hypothetical protein [Agrobacterium]|uniref:hypothetical protein n=1 Tax=Agrobacterium tumefaciens TaxID=358 RepID=UPI0015746E4F|nr:hypothetical protein [Agrobacterium tumefaciens]NSZ73323.1 hypothetical protein [Agrobacterium tumefaciens]
MNMIERLARVIASDEYGSNVDDVWANYVDVARAVLDAMREPTDTMRRECDGWNASTNDMEACYQAMIDAALNDEGMR